VADLTPELLAQLNDDVRWLSNHAFLTREPEDQVIARCLRALPTLVAAAKERDQLEATAVQLLDEAKEARVRMTAVVEERDQLAGVVDALVAHVRALLQVIDRKSYSSAAQQEAVRAAEAAIGEVPNG
jgi:predicted signal transduction protein with EAL and GGDEF domain